MNSYGSGFLHGISCFDGARRRKKANVAEVLHPMNRQFRFLRACIIHVGSRSGSIHLSCGKENEGYRVVDIGEWKFSGYHSVQERLRLITLRLRYALSNEVRYKYIHIDG